MAQTPLPPFEYSVELAGMADLSQIRAFVFDTLSDDVRIRRFEVPQTDLPRDIPERLQGGRPGEIWLARAAIDRAILGFADSRYATLVAYHAGTNMAVAGLFDKVLGTEPAIKYLDGPMQTGGAVSRRYSL